MRPLAASFRSVSNCTCAASWTASQVLQSSAGFRLGTVNHGLRDARQRPHDLLRVETAGNERLAHAAQPRRGRFGADVAVLVPPQEASGKIVRIGAAAAEPLHEEGRRRSAVEVREHLAQQFVLLDAAIQVLDQRRHAVAAAQRLPEIRLRILDERFPAMAQFLLRAWFRNWWRLASLGSRRKWDMTSSFQGRLASAHQIERSSLVVGITGGLMAGRGDREANGGTQSGLAVDHQGASMPPPDALGDGQADS